jgi:hypothetical protein
LLGNLKVIAVDGFEEEYNKIVQSKPNCEKINKKLLLLLSFICMDNNPEVFCTHKQIEKLSGASGLYVIKIKVGCNIRVLFSLERDGTILLHSFQEKAGKSNTDYSSAIIIANNRLLKYKGGNNENTRRR